MNIIINDIPCNAMPGQTIGKSAWLNHSHVGCVCGGRGICQTCYVTVIGGAECLSPLSDIEKAFLSDRQIQSGGRLACQAVIEKDGSLQILSRPEEVQRLLLRNPLALFSYGATMGKDTASRILPGISNLAGRIVRREVHPLEEQSIIGSPVAVAPITITAGETVLPVPENSVDVVPVAVSVPPAKTPSADSASVTLPGIDEGSSRKLAAVGITTIDQLLEKGRNRIGRKELATAAGIGEELLFTMIHRADLARISELDPANTKLLEAAGVANLVDLGQRNPANLYNKMQSINNQKKIVQLVPSVDRIKEWVNQAKRLPKVLIT